MAKSQNQKYQLSMAGEYGVCAELCKRGYDISITMGNTKAVDIFVFLQDGTMRRVEVKTTRSSRFVTRFFQKYFNKSLNNHPDIWVLVHIDTNNNSRFFILTHEEMGKVQMKRNGMTQWVGVPKGCDNVLLSHVEQYENIWDTINNDI